MFDNKFRILVIEGYQQSAREELIQGGMAAASEIYKKMFLNLAPNASIDIVTPADSGATVPTNSGLKSYDGAAMTGSSLSVLDSDNPAVQSQFGLVSDLFEQGVPSFGSCWAMQVGVVVAGGKVGVNPKGREMGFARKIALTENGKSHPFYEGKTDVFDSFASHEDEVVSPPPDSTVLSGNSISAVQSMEIRHLNGVMWCVQYHPEYDTQELAALIRCRKEKLIDMGFFENAESLADFTEKLKLVHNDGDRKDLTWALGIDGDILDAPTRQREVINWLQYQVLPRYRQRTSV